MNSFVNLSFILAHCSAENLSKRFELDQYKICQERGVLKHHEFEAQNMDRVSCQDACLLEASKPTQETNDFCCFFYDASEPQEKWCDLISYNSQLLEMPSTSDKLYALAFSLYSDGDGNSKVNYLSKGHDDYDRLYDEDPEWTRKKIILTDFFMGLIA